MIWLNGKLVNEDAAISAQDRGLLLGESLFETVLVRDAIPQFWAAHLARLQAGCAAFDLPCPYQAADFRDGFIALQNQSDTAARAVLRITVTGGTGGRGLVGGLVGGQGQPTIIMQISQAAPPPDALVLVDSDVMRLAGAKTNTAKTGTYFDNILARKQAVAAGGDEALLFNQFDRLASTASGNIFVAFGDRFLTPPVSDGALPGIIRAHVLQRGTLNGVRFEEGEIARARLQDADGFLVSNSLNGLVAANYKTVSAAQKKQGHALNEALPKFSDF